MRKLLSLMIFTVSILINCANPLNRCFLNGASFLSESEEVYLACSKSCSCKESGILLTGCQSCCCKMVERIPVPDKDPCMNHRCNNGGKCIAGVGMEHTCECSEGFTGEFCQDKTSASKKSNPTTIKTITLIAVIVAVILFGITIVGVFWRFRSRINCCVNSDTGKLSEEEKGKLSEEEKGKLSEEEKDYRGKIKYAFISKVSGISNPIF